MRSTKRAFTEEFKRETVKLLERSEKTLDQLSIELGVGRSTLSAWKAEFGNPRVGRKRRGQVIRTEEETEVLRLKRDLEQARREIEILKKATAFFARGHI